MRRQAARQVRPRASVNGDLPDWDEPPPPGQPSTSTPPPKRTTTVETPGHQPPILLSFRERIITVSLMYIFGFVDARCPSDRSWPFNRSQGGTAGPSRSLEKRLGRLLVLAITYLAGLGTSDLWPQVSQDASDPYGFAIAYPFVHLVHSSDIARPGTTGHLRAADPFLLYQLGHDLTTRKFTLAEGAYGREGELSVPLYVMSPLGVATPPPSRFARDHAASCGSCHSTPAREPGAGQTISSTAGMGRNTPHFYGAGLVEMIA